MWDRVSALMEEKHITIYRLCEELNLPKTTFYRWKKAGKINNVNILNKVAEYFGISITELL